MQLKSKDRKAKINEEINDSLRQVVVAPSNFEKMKEQVKIFRGLNQIFLGKEAKTTEIIWDFYKLIKKNESALKHKCNNDNLLPTKFCILVCSKVQLWLAQCEISQDR